MNPDDNILELEQQLKAVASAIPDPIFIISEHGRYSGLIGGADKKLYHAGTSLVGKYLHEVLDKEKADFFLNVIHRAIASESLQVVEYQLGSDEVDGLEKENGPEGKQWFEGRAYPLKGNGKIRRVVWVATNITKRKIAEDRLKELAVTDDLTGSFNRRYFISTLETWLREFKRYGEIFSLLSMDLDYFKEINDIHGHDVGDFVLREFARLCQAQTRNTDIFARTGGDEFFILLPKTSLENAIVQAHRLRDFFKGQKVTINNREISFSISMGLCQVLPTDNSYRDITTRADKALYLAKKSGRNKLVIQDQ